MITALIAATDPVDLADPMSRGFEIAIAGMVIVAFALSIISLFIAALPKMLAVLEIYLPTSEDGHSKPVHPESFVPDDDAVVAAIGFVLHTEFQKQVAQDQTATSNK